MCEAGNRVVFDDKEGSYIMNNKTKKITRLVNKSGVYKFNIMIPKELSSVEASSSSSGGNTRNDATVVTRNRFEALSESFHRQETSW